MFKHIPNILTMIRFLLIPSILMFIVKDNYIGASIMLVISGITDVADGVIARKFNLVTDFGKLVDPLADKATQISTLVAIVLKGIIPSWILAIILLKEMVMIAGASFLYGRNLVVSSKWFGKLSTVILYMAIFFSMLIKQFDLGNLYMQYNNYLYYFAILCTVFSLVMYFKKFFDRDLLKSQKQ